MLAAVEAHGEARGLPRHQRADRRIRVDEVAAHEARLVRDPVRLRVVAHGGDAREGLAVRLTEVERLAHARPASTLHAPGMSWGMPIARAKSLPRPPGRTPSGRRAVQRAGERADQPVAAQRDHDLAVLGRVAGGVRGVREVPRLDDPIRRPGGCRAPSSPPAAGAAACRSRRSGSSGSRTCGRRSWPPRKVVRPGPGRPGGERLEALALVTLRAASRPGCRTGVTGPREAMWTTYPPGRSSAATGAKNGGMFSMITRS